jgi:hypothetical protein
VHSQATTVDEDQSSINGRFAVIPGGRVSESGCRKREQQSALEALWALGAPEPKKRLKRPDGGLDCGGKGAENSPKGAVFCRLTTGTETYWVLIFFSIDELPI